MKRLTSLAGGRRNDHGASETGELSPISGLPEIGIFVPKSAIADLGAKRRARNP